MAETLDFSKRESGFYFRSYLWLRASEQTLKTFNIRWKFNEICQTRTIKIPLFLNVSTQESNEWRPWLNIFVELSTEPQHPQ